MEKFNMVIIQKAKVVKTPQNLVGKCRIFSVPFLKYASVVHYRKKEKMYLL